MSWSIKINLRMEMISILDNLEKWLVYPFEKVSRKIPDREKHFNILVFTLFSLLASCIPLWGSHVRDSGSEISFKIFGSLMQLGTQPFVFSSMVSPFLFKEPKKSTTNIVGFLLSILMSFHWILTKGSFIGGIELMLMSLFLLNAEFYLEERSLISATTSLIIANASSKILMSIYFRPIAFIWMWVLVLLVSWIDSLSVSVPLTHMKHRHQSTGVELPVMYNSTSALIMYYTVFETFAHWYKPFGIFLPSELDYSFLFGAFFVWVGIYVINKKLTDINKTNGRDLVSKWKKQKYTLKGWRDPKKMSKYVQNIVDRNVQWNTVFTCVLWTLSKLFPAPVGVTTLFILISTVKRHRKTLF